MRSKRCKNRVRDLIENHGERIGLGIALFHYREAFIELDKREMSRWQRELQEVCSGPQPKPEPVSTRFSAADIIRAHSMGVQL